MGSNGEKSNIALAILEKLPVLTCNNISHFDGGNNNVFVNCTETRILIGSSLQGLVNIGLVDCNQGRVHMQPTTQFTDTIQN